MNKLQQILQDRRVLYLLLFLSVSLPFLIKVPAPKPAVSPAGRAYFNTIEDIAQSPEAKNKLIIVSSNYGGGTYAENRPQLTATLRHLMARKLKFAVFAFNDPQAEVQSHRVMDELAKEYGYVYGTDYVNWGFRPPEAITTIFKAMVQDVPGTIKTEFNGKALSTIPVMQGIKKPDDISLIIEVSGSFTQNAWIQFFQGSGKDYRTNPPKEGIPLLFAPTGVMAPEAYPLLASGQLSGMLNGMKGAAEYETLLLDNNIVKDPGFGIRAMASQSFAHFLILSLIALGNYFFWQERRNKQGGRRTNV
jgi:hypothetical protein